MESIRLSADEKHKTEQKIQLIFATDESLLLFFMPLHRLMNTKWKAGNEYLG